MDGLDDLGVDAHATCQVATPLVLTKVGERAIELVEQVGVGGVDLDTVEARLLCTTGSLRELIDGGRDVVRRHCVWGLLVAQAITVEALREQRHRNVAGTPGILSDDPAERATATVVELSQNRRAGLVADLDESREALDAVVGLNAQLVVTGTTASAHIQVLGDDQTQASASHALAVVVERDVARVAARLVLVRGHGRHEDAILELERSRTKAFLAEHGTSPLSPTAFEDSMARELREWQRTSP